MNTVTNSSMKIKSSMEVGYEDLTVKKNLKLLENVIDLLIFRRFGDSTR